MEMQGNNQEAVIGGIPGNPVLLAGIASTHDDRTRGLMHSAPRNLLLVFPARQSVCLHTFFMRFDITALALDDAFRVLETAFLVPNKGYCLKSRTRYVLELAGSHSVEPGTQLAVTFRTKPTDWWRR